MKKKQENFGAVKLEEIHSPEEIKGLTYEQLGALAQEIRERIVDVVSKNGGHLASNLGIVEATLALHKVFDSPRDQIVFDVGHQCYAHKLLTGRYEQFSSLRTFGGISGFTNPTESEHDPFYEGHCGTSLSAAIGLASANALENNGRHAVAVVGDGACTNGMIFEALNNCTGRKLDLVILLNDNEMSISKNVGGVPRYFSRIRTSKKYFSLRRGTMRFLRKIPLIGRGVYAMTRWFKVRLKRMFAPDNIFENLGLDYIGAIDGHNIKKVCQALEEAKRRGGCVVVHIRTKKGKGYEKAENAPDLYHGTGCFDPAEGVPTADKTSFSSVFGEIVSNEAKENGKLVAVTAAMCDGTGLKGFSKAFPDRFFDVGIAEEHAVTFAGGLAQKGFKPVCAIYSTFIQRSVDQVFHDLAIQGTSAVFALDRAGFVPADGITHQGIYDFSLFSALPRTEIYSPETYAEMKTAFSAAFVSNEIAVVRYPRGAQNAQTAERFLSWTGEALLRYTEGVEEAETVVITYGKVAANAAEAVARVRENGGSVGVIKPVKLYPIDAEKLLDLTANAKRVLVVEEGAKSGGFGEKLAATFAQNGVNKLVKIRAVEEFVPHGSVAELYEKFGFSVEQLETFIKE